MDLARTRFGFSPLWEAVMSYRALQHPCRFAIHLPWIKEAQEAAPQMNLRPLQTLMHPNWCIPDFLTPPPTTPLATFEDELAKLRQTDPEIVRREVRLAWSGHADLPADSARYLEHPQAALEELSETLHTYWKQLIAPHWPRWQALLENDVLERARRLALHGPEALFQDMSPLIQFEGQTLSLHESCVNRGETYQLADRGLLLVPSVFAWPAYNMILDPPWQPTLAYMPRGAANLWLDAPPPVSHALETLLGRGRASVLLGVETPATTSQLAASLGLAASSVSEHLSVLRESGLVQPRRDRRVVYYRLSPTGRALLDLLGDAESTASSRYWLRVQKPA
jgi:DNA-binding transcriptional ArsR family regulator